MAQNPGLSIASPGKDLLGDIPDALPSPALGKLASAILDDVFYNIIYDIVHKVHREEKVARATTAVVLAESQAEKELASAASAAGVETVGAAGGGDHDTTDTNNNTTVPDKESQGVKVETAGAISEGGVVRLRGNPLETTREVVCPDCRLPRLLYPLFGEGARAVPDPDREYCRKRPPILLPGRDINGRAFATEKVTTKKKANPTNPKAIASPSSPPSSPSSSIPQNHPGSANPLSELTQLPPKEVYVPSVKCPNCPRYFFLTRIASHLDRCMGISTRQSSRNRTPMDASALSTPASSQAAGVKRSRGPDGDDEAGVPAGVAKRKKRPAGPSKLRGNHQAGE